MPIYEFSCAKCGNLSEVVQRVGARPPPCPVCGSKRMTRAVSRTAFHLKGGGWYADLYATPRPGADKGEGAEPAKPAEGAAASPTPAAEKPAAGAKAEPAAAPPSAEGAARKAGAPREGSRPPRRPRSTPSRRR
jgi:putative FmdB family regulatory protein